MSTLKSNSSRGYLRNKIFLLTFSLVVFSLLSYALYSISSLRAEKRRLLYYAVQIENSMLFQKTSELLQKSEFQLKNKCPGLTETNFVFNIQGTDLVMGNKACSLTVDLTQLQGSLAAQSASNIYFYDAISDQTLVRAQPVTGPVTVGKNDSLVLSAQASPGTQGIFDFQRVSDHTEFVGSFSKLKNGRFLLLTETMRQGLLSELQSLAWNLFLFAIVLGAICFVVLIRPLVSIH